MTGPELIHCSSLISLIRNAIACARLAQVLPLTRPIIYGLQLDTLNMDSLQVTIHNVDRLLIYFVAIDKGTF